MGVNKVLANQKATVFINVYLKLQPENQVLELVTKFTSFLEERQILNTYQVKPFINQHPLHLTLYLAHYSESQLPVIIQHIQLIAKHQKPIPLQTETIQVTPSGYTLLMVKNNKALQSLSEQVVLNLMPLRDRQAKIPSWAKNDSKKVASFLKYGSPNVFRHFSPHFSLFAQENLSQYESKQLNKRLRKLVQKFNSTNKTKVTARAYVIAIGLADLQGQILKEFKTFTLNEN